LSLVAERLLECGEVNFANLSLRVVKPSRSLLYRNGSADVYYNDTDDASDSGDESNYDDAATTTVIVSHIPTSLSENYLCMFLENSRRSGGGEITEMQFDQKSATAVVTFASPQGDEYLVPYDFFHFRSELCP